MRINHYPEALKAISPNPLRSACVTGQLASFEETSVPPSPPTPLPNLGEGR
ncbi:hypothetical protein [Lusitaniella coriacea]|uniref:hypothetical protein n=1 Tax=Lusitaniella coriacea TaxID=1983105 RepID=UPI003CED698E